MRDWLRAAWRERPASLSLALLLSLLLWLDYRYPPPLPGRDAAQALVVLARDGTPLRAFPDRDHVWRQPVARSAVSPLYLEALITYEDRWFRWHPGVNPFSLVRAAWQWLSRGRIVSGGSTLTMQVARILEPQPRSLAGKLRQIARALQLELRLSKDEILALYCNYAPMGGVLEGVEAASRAYLGKSAQRLGHAEAALLTVLPQAPSLLRPDRYPERARAARDKVLKRLEPRWGKAAVRDALQEPAYAQTVRDPLLAPLLAERLRKSAAGRARIDTTIDAQAQSTVELLLADRVGGLPPRVSLAALVMDNRTLEVLAYAGSADFGDDNRFSHVDMICASRSPGSTLKPFLYGFALDEGLIHSESLLADVPQSFGGYQPGNFQQSFHGPVSVSEALGKSLNVPAVEVLDRLDPKRFAALLRRGGIKLDYPRGGEPNLALILGGAGTTLEQLVGAYSAFARRGLAGKPRLTGDRPVEEMRMMSEGAAFIIRDILEAGGPVSRLVEGSVGARRGIAWKTGTSFGFRDAWAIGVSDRLTVGVWVGRPDGTPNPGFFGANVAAPLLVDIFAALDPEPPEPRVPPATVSRERICWPLGVRPNGADDPACHQPRTAWALNGATPPTFPDRIRRGEPRYAYFTDPAGRQRFVPGCARGPLRRVDTARWPAVLEPWLSDDVRQRVLPPPWAPECREERTGDGLKIIGLGDGAILRQAKDGAAPLVQLQVRGGSGEILWLVDGRLAARRPADAGHLHRFAEPGRHTVTALGEDGGYDRISISVR